MDNILNMAIASGLKFSIRNKYYRLSDLPSNVFGVFVAVIRSNSNTHGCVGSWNPDHQALDNKQLMKNILKYAYDATWIDPRRKHFKHSIYVDLQTKYRIYFMIGPPIPIDPTTGILNKTELFNNSYYGLIVEDKVNILKRATFLPLTTNSNWPETKQSILTKTDINESNANLFAYNCIIVSASIADYFFKPIQRFIDRYTINFIPYNIKDDSIIIERSEIIPNLQTISMLLSLPNPYKLSKTATNSIISNIGYYKSVLNSEPKSMINGMPLLSLDTYYLDPDDPYNKIISSKLYSELSKELENPTEKLGEILTVLNKTDPTNIQFQKIIQLVTRNNKILSKLDINGYNWFAKLANKTNDKYSIQLLRYATNYYRSHSLTTTNDYAIMFETMATLYKSTANPQIKVLIERYLEKLIVNLEHRKNIYGLYIDDNSEAHLYVTSHVLNGLTCLYNIND